MRLCSSACLLSLLILERTTLAAEPVSPVVPVVPDGFTIEKAAPSPLIQRPIFAAFDDAGFLFVGESNGENLKRDDMLAKKPHWITRLEDTDDDGVFDTARKFVEGITLPQGMLCYRGSVYAACPPSIWKFTDTDGDGKADQREEILTGFSGNACDTHGPFLSPTGRLYIAQGRHGHEFKDKDGQTYSKGKAARIYSCRLDGSDVRVHCGGGFDNPVEIDFTEEGEAIGTVNILYRDRGDCLMHWVEGGVYPREDQADCVAEFKWTGGLLGPVHNLGHVACSGLMRYRGVHFGDEFKNRWFVTEFNTHKVRCAELKRSGSTFTADVHEFLTSSSPDFHPTDVLERNSADASGPTCPRSRSAARPARSPHLSECQFRQRLPPVHHRHHVGQDLHGGHQQPNNQVDHAQTGRPHRSPGPRGSDRLAEGRNHLDHAEGPRHAAHPRRTPQPARLPASPEMTRPLLPSRGGTRRAGDKERGSGGRGEPPFTLARLLFLRVDLKNGSHEGTKSRSRDN